MPKSGNLNPIVCSTDDRTDRYDRDVNQFTQAQTSKTWVFRICRTIDDTRSISLAHPRRLAKRCSHCTTPRVRLPFLVNGAEAQLSGPKHYDNPYCCVDLGSSRMELSLGGLPYRLAFGLGPEDAGAGG